MRQHVNPLSRFFQLHLELPEPAELFADGKLPIHLDIGSARGKFLLKIASIETDWNFLGVEIRSALVDSAEKERKELDLENLRFLYCNANVSLENWFRSLENGQLQRVSIQFPDPWFKKRHQKRRVLSPPFLFTLASALSPNSELFIQSDVLPVINSMVEVVENTGLFERVSNPPTLWLANSPYKVSTEREEYVVNKGLPIYRTLFIRNNQAVLSIR